MPGKTTDPIDRQYRNYVENLYSTVPRDQQEKIIENIMTLIEMGHDRRQTLNTTLEFAAKMIFRLFGFQEISIGLKNRADGTFKYDIIFGFRKDVELNYRRLRYTLEDMISQERYPFIKTGKSSEYNPVEGLPERECTLYNRPYQVKTQRKGFDDFHEGDYFDVWMYGPNKELIGWIEVMGTPDDKLPPRGHIRWLELIAAVCADIVLEKWSRGEDLQRATGA